MTDVPTSRNNASLILISLIYGFFSGSCESTEIEFHEAFSHSVTKTSRFQLLPWLHSQSDPRMSGTHSFYDCDHSLTNNAFTSAKTGLILAISSFAFMGSTPVSGALLTSEFRWERPIVFAGVSDLTKYE